MQIILEGSRFTSDTLTRASYAPPEALPELTEEQKRLAKSFRLSEEEYSRTVYAELLNEPELAATVERLGSVLEMLLATSLPGAAISCITFQTARGMFRVEVDKNGYHSAFSIRESVVSDLLEGGDEDALGRLRRIVEMASLPYLPKQRVS